MGETIGVLILAAIVLFLIGRTLVFYVRSIFDPAYRRRLMGFSSGGKQKDTAKEKAEPQ